MGKQIIPAVITIITPTAIMASAFFEQKKSLFFFGKEEQSSTVALNVAWHTAHWTFWPKDVLSTEYSWLHSGQTIFVFICELLEYYMSNRFVVVIVGRMRNVKSKMIPFFWSWMIWRFRKNKKSRTFSIRAYEGPTKNLLRWRQRNAQQDTKT